jgi:hypothetical protein
VNLFRALLFAFRGVGVTGILELGVGHPAPAQGEIRQPVAGMAGTAYNLHRPVVGPFNHLDVTGRAVSAEDYRYVV